MGSDMKNAWILGTTALFLGGWSLARPQDATGGVESVPVVEETPGAEPRAIDLALCLDTSGSMGGLIDAAKQKLWAIVNDMALARPTPTLRVALFTFGHDTHSPEDGWVKMETGLTEDLDLVSQILFGLSTNGGTEYVGRVLDAATRRLAWSPSPAALKLVVVAGNESADQDPVVGLRAASRNAIERGIMVDSIYCGNPADELAPAWRELAQLADGHFASIDHDNGTVVIASPFDARLAELSGALNATYVPYGADGRRGWANQQAQDQNAVGLNSEAAACRAVTKVSGLYNCAWDLVDKCKEKDFDWAKVETKDLPEDMRSMTLEQRQELVNKRAAEREKLQAEVASLGRKRQEFVEQELRKQAAGDERTFDFALRRAVREQARAKGFRYPDEQARPESPSGGEREEAKQPGEAGGK